MKKKSQNNPAATENDANEAKKSQERRIWIWKTGHIATSHATPYKFNPKASPRAPARAAISESGVAFLKV